MLPCTIGRPSFHLDDKPQEFVKLQANFYEDFLLILLMIYFSPLLQSHIPSSDWKDCVLSEFSVCRDRGLGKWAALGVDSSLRKDLDHRITGLKMYCSPSM